MLQNFNLSQTERVSIIKKNWLSRQGQQLLETLAQAEQEACNNKEGLFKILNKNSSNNTMRQLNHYNSEV